MPLKARRAGAALALSVALGGCGYHSAVSVRDPAGPYRVVGGPIPVADAGAQAALEAGARAELSRLGQLGACGEVRCAALVVDLVRVEEGGGAIAAPGAGAPPHARALVVSVTGRAHLDADGASPGGPRATGDMSATEVVARPADPALGGMIRDEAVRRAARRLGERLVRRFLGSPEPSAE